MDVCKAISAPVASVAGVAPAARAPGAMFSVFVDKIRVPEPSVVAVLPLVDALAVDEIQWIDALDVRRWWRRFG